MGIFNGKNPHPRAKNGEETVIKKLHRKYFNYFSLSFLYEYYKANNYVLNFVDTCEKIDKAIIEFENETEGYIKCVEDAQFSETIMNYIHNGCYPQSTKRVQVIQTRISESPRYKWYVNLELFEKEERLPMKVPTEKKRIYKEKENGSNQKDEIQWMLIFIQNHRKNIIVDMENKTVDGYHLHYYVNKLGTTRIKIKELNIDLSDYINYEKNENAGQFNFNSKKKQNKLQEIFAI